MPTELANVLLNWRLQNLWSVHIPKTPDILFLQTRKYNHDTAHFRGTCCRQSYVRDWSWSMWSDRSMEVTFRTIVAESQARSPQEWPPWLDAAGVWSCGGQRLSYWQDSASPSLHQLNAARVVEWVARPIFLPLILQPQWAQCLFLRLVQHL